MLRNLIAGGPALSRGVTRAVGAMIVLVYWIVYAKAGTFLPEFVFRDAEKIQSQIGGGSTYEGTSFDAVAKFYALLGPVGTSLFVAAIGTVFIWRIVGEGRRLGSLAAIIVLLAPCVFFNLFVASKDTLVVLIALVLAGTARRRSTAWTFVAVVALYAGYAAVVRSYFALILAISLAAFLFRHVSWRGKTLLISSAAIALFLLPPDVYYLLQHPRDMAADYLAYGSPFGARTSFYNPVAPDSFFAFCANFAYAVLRLNLPLLFDVGLKELAMQLFVWIALAAVWRRARHDTHPARDLLACVVIGHVAVSMLFEPDLGSYTRHLSSVALLCALQFAGFDARAGRRWSKRDAAKNDTRQSNALAGPALARLRHMDTLN
ncbi:hypothetical protein BLA6993_01354 [Burkholderia lata]|uniref:hypothetical protein n=1 Tax=Burkholderia lata (strain ATCC 17760 / DSM 23089 / LMG 22485 / NCIMB 9086 / R18194 / 383) TaxID=482957 RepID=UPI0014540C1D|nr:hypothetical protein [Burkholderia lata]VWB31367.1 hypothetical protein BLA6993_01354 [Burkholderia lata]